MREDLDYRLLRTVVNNPFPSTLYLVMVMVIFSALVRSHQSTSPVASASCVPRG